MSPHSLSLSEQRGKKELLKRAPLSWAHRRLIGQPSLTVGGANKQHLQHRWKSMMLLAPEREAVRENVIFSLETSNVRRARYFWAGTFAVTLLRLDGPLPRMRGTRSGSPGPAGSGRVLTMSFQYYQSIINDGWNVKALYVTFCTHTVNVRTCEGPEMLNRAVNVFRRPVPCCRRVGAAAASEGRAENHRAYEEVFIGRGTTEQQRLLFSRSAGRTNFKMPGKKVCIVGSGNW